MYYGIDDNDEAEMNEEATPWVINNIILFFKDNFTGFTFKKTLKLNNPFIYALYSYINAFPNLFLWWLIHWMRNYWVYSLSKLNFYWRN